ncbi:MAG: hypothetical protein DRP45_04890 [Candidatus Zixiibacteriota bacterium]|nr:MAG: hypothetical protein DRP45_04890 [candidate division Zixibacteria bacterium]
MKIAVSISVALGLTVLLAFSALADNSGRIYGKLYTVDGGVFEGLIRWDKNEGNWVDVLDGTKDRDSRRGRSKYRSSRRKYNSGVKIFGWDLGSTSYTVYTGASQSGVRFGHIKELEVIDDDLVLLTMKSGEEIELTNGSTDIGSAIREIVIEDLDEGEIEFSWDDLDRIEFSAATTDEPSVFGERLYGTLTTRRGDEYTGFVCWDIDELFTEDILDGKEKRRKRKLEFGKIAAIERYSSSGALIELKSGEEMTLRGTNDVDSDNSGIVISDPGFGQIEVEWDEFDRLEFSKPGKQISYDKFNGGKKLRGTVYTEDGEEYTGTICWDDDEEYTWEILDGDYRDMEFKIELGLVKSIEKNSYRSSTVTVWDGREFRLRGCNDVDEDNKGIFVTLDDGDEAEIDWEDFERVEFSK